MRKNDILPISTRNLKVFLFFLVPVILVLLFWWQMVKSQKILEEFFFWKIVSSQQIAPNPADISSFFPLRKWGIEDLKIGAPSSILVEKTLSEKILFKKNEDRRMPLASLTKLMTALVIFENPDRYNLSSLVEINEEAILKESGETKMRAGDIFSVGALLYLMLLESSNGAAHALSEVVEQEYFVDLMNGKARNLGLKNTYFANPTGLDPMPPEEKINYSTAEDLVKFTDYLLKNHSKIWEISSLKEYTIKKHNGETIGLVNTNQLLGEIPGLIGGKTGWTLRARGNLLLVLHNPSRTGYLIAIVLGSENRFQEAKNIVQWTRKAYKWW